MAPNLLGSSALFLAETTTTEEPVSLPNKHNGIARHEDLKLRRSAQKEEEYHYRWQIVWRNVFAFIYLHAGALYGLYLASFVCKWQTNVWTLSVMQIAGLGITAGAHRLWAHKTYKAKLSLRIFLAILQTLSFQNHIYEWVRDHRVHHKFTDTNADPHNAKRGFFFSHIGWLMLKKHKDVFVKGKTVDMRDLEEDAVVMFQKKYYLLLTPLLCFVIPTLVPWYFWGETLMVAWYTSAVMRYTLSLNFTWLVNSAAHIWGTKPYDKNMGPAENISVAILALGEGWHNYHHVFPWDYKAAELGNYRTNLTTMVIDFFAKIGLAYDLKTASLDMVKKRIARTGDGTRKFGDSNTSTPNNHHDLDSAIWGWGDKDMSEEDLKDVKFYNKLD